MKEITKYNLKAVGWIALTVILEFLIFTVYEIIKDRYIEVESASYVSLFYPLVTSGIMLAVIVLLLPKVEYNLNKVTQLYNGT